MIAFLLLATVVVGLWLMRMPCYIAVIVVIVLLCYSFYRFKKKGAIIFAFFLLCGVSLSFFERVEAPKKTVYQGFVISSKDNYFLLKSGLHKYYVYEKDSKREIGDFLHIKGQLRKNSFTNYESKFDFNEYLKNKGVFYELRNPIIEVKFQNPLRINEHKDRFLDKFDKETSSLIDALLFSRKNYNDEALRVASSMNVVFLFSMCGVYLRLLMNALEYILKLKLSDKIARILSIVILLPLYIVNLEKVAVHRIFISSSFRVINDYRLVKKMTYATLMGLLGGLFIIYDFYLVYQMGFLLGFGLSFLIMLLRHGLNSFPRKMRKLAMGLALFIFLIPIHISLTAELHLFQIVYQYLILPVNTIFFLLSIIAFYGVPLVPLLNFAGQTLHDFYLFLYKWDFVIVCGEPHILFIAGYYLFFFRLPYLLESKRLKSVKKEGLILAFSLIIGSLPIRNTFFSAIHFINVGQGDAILIQRRKQNILIDTGGNINFDMANEVLIPFFKKQRVYKIDFLIVTHDDFDHCGALASLVENYQVSTIITRKNAFPLIVDDIVINNLNLVTYSDTNDNSLVLHFSLLKKSWLLMGDASIVVEKEIITRYSTLDIDYLKVGHHGSKTSTCEAFIKQITPEEAIISVGRNNYYGHPHDEVLSLLNKYEVTTRRTDYEGTISYYQPLF